MSDITLNEIRTFVKQNIGSFHSARLDSLKKLELRKILKRKNPYLFKAKHVFVASDLVRMLLDAHISSQEETMFGDFLEKLAIYICSQAYGGRKSAAQGIDLEFEKDGRVYIGAIKSGPHWGNSSQVRRMKQDFNQARRILRSNNQTINVMPVNGCCYGKDNKPDKGEYIKLCGQRFWEFISGRSELYVQIIEPLGYTAKQRKEDFEQAYGGIITQFTVEFAKDFCTADGTIDWEKLVRFNSAIPYAQNAKTAFNSGNYQEAQQLAELALKAELLPNTKALMHRILGEIAEHQEEHQEAIRQYEQAIEFNPKVGVKLRLRALHKQYG